MATLESINARIAKLQAQAESLAAKKSTAVLDRIRALMTKHGIEIADIEAHVGKRRGRKQGAVAAAKQSTSVAKYRDPKSGATWSGHGRAPQWIANAKDHSRFLIDGASSSPASAAKKAAKAGNYRRGPQPALYQDPKTGATWSGRGRAPAWLASVRDRSRFLIAGVGALAVEPKPSSGKKVAPAKKAVAAKKGQPAKKAATAEKTAPTKTAAAARKAPAAKKVAAAKKASVNRPASKKVAKQFETPVVGSEASEQATELSTTPVTE